VAIKDLNRVTGKARYLLIASIWLNVCTVCVILVGIYGAARFCLSIITVVSLRYPETCFNVQFLCINIILVKYLTTLAAYFLGKFFISITVELLEKKQFDLILTPFYTINGVFCVSRHDFKMITIKFIIISGNMHWISGIFILRAEGS